MIRKFPPTLLRYKPCMRFCGKNGRPLPSSAFQAEKAENIGRCSFQFYMAYLDGGRELKMEGR